MSKHHDHFLAQHLKRDERVKAWADCYTGKAFGTGKDKATYGAMIVTDQRVAFVSKGWLGETVETIEIRKITSIERKSSLGHHTTTLHTANDSLTFTCIGEQGARAVYDAIEDVRSAISDAR